MLQVSLTPATVADGEVDQGGWARLVRAVQIVGDPHAPAGATEQGSLDEIVAQDGTAEGRATGQLRQPARFHERARADEGVVSPEVSLASRPPGQPRSQNRSVDPCGELLQARDQRRSFVQARHGLDQPGVGIVFHAANELDDGRPLHQAVRVQDQEVIVGAAPAFAELPDVS